MGSDESHFNVALIVRDKVTRQCPQLGDVEIILYIIYGSTWTVFSAQAAAGSSGLFPWADTCTELVWNKRGKTACLQGAICSVGGS